jgi:hypothetical protein
MIHDIGSPHDESGKLDFSNEKTLFLGHLREEIDSTGQNTYCTIIPVFQSLLVKIYGADN